MPMKSVMLHWLCSVSAPPPRSGMTNDPPHPVPAGRTEERAAEPNPLHAEQIRLLFRFSVVGTLATLLVVLLLGALLWDDLSNHGLFAWFVLISLVTLGRYGLYKAFVQRERSVA